MTDEDAIRLLRHRRAQWFMGDDGPPLPPGTSAHWRVTPDDPHGWQANMVGFIDAAPEQLGTILDTASHFFTAAGADTWVDADEWSALWHVQHLLDQRGFALQDDWDAMLCHKLQQPRPTDIHVHWASTDADLRAAAWIAEQINDNAVYALAAPNVTQRLQRYSSEWRSWNTRFALATLDDVPICTARLTDEELPVIVGVATLPAARGRGAASALTAFLTEYALRTKHACALYTERRSQAARIYQHLGYTLLYRTRAWKRKSVNS